MLRLDILMIETYKTTHLTLGTKDSLLDYWPSIFNRPGVTGAVLQTPL